MSSLLKLAVLSQRISRASELDPAFLTVCTSPPNRHDRLWKLSSIGKRAGPARHAMPITRWPAGVRSTWLLPSTAMTGVNVVVGSAKAEDTTDSADARHR